MLFRSKDYTGAEIITKGSTFTATALKNLEYDGVQSNKWIALSMILLIILLIVILRLSFWLMGIKQVVKSVALFNVGRYS